MVRLDPRSTCEEAEAAVAAARGSEVVLASLFVRARSGAGKIAVPESGRKALSELLEGDARDAPVVAVSFGSPYLLSEFPGLQTYICAYGTQEIVQEAVARALFGEAPLDGRLPVTIPGLAPRGSGYVKLPK